MVLNILLSDICQESTKQIGFVLDMLLKMVTLLLCPFVYRRPKEHKVKQIPHYIQVILKNGSFQILAIRIRYSFDWFTF